MEKLGGGSVTYFKFKNPGDYVEGIFESFIWGAPGKFGNESSIRVKDEAGGVIQARLSTSLVSIFRGSQSRFVPGKTKVCVTFLGKKASKKDPSKTYNDFDVQAEGLLPKGVAANVAAAASVLGDGSDSTPKDSTPPANGGDTSFDPKSLS